MSRPCVLLPVSICKFIMMTAMILSNISILFESNTFIRIGKNIVICAISFVSITCAVWLLGCCHFSIQHFPFRLSIFIWFWVFDFMCIFMQHTKSKIFMNIKKKIKKKKLLTNAINFSCLSWIILVAIASLLLSSKFR